MKTLVIVDLQKDFYSPDGALYVKGGENIPQIIANVMHQFDSVVFTADWHPFNHCSFTENGGIWPTHCVQFTDGASFPNELKPFIKNNIVIKGNHKHKEEYGADPFQIMDMIEKMKPEHSSMCDPNNEVVFCGLAFDFCVLETIKNFIKTYPSWNVSIFLDGGASIDNGEKINKFIVENNIKIWKP